MHRATISLISAALLSTASFPDAGALHVRTLAVPAVIGHEVIVGRAHCAGVTWLLTDVPELTGITIETSTVSSSSVRSLRPAEKPWGLACLSNHELWTLASQDSLARMQADGTVVERLRLDRPRLAIFGVGERLLLQHPPSASGRSLLAAGVPRNLAGFRPWPAPLSQPVSSRDEQIQSNLVKCGLGTSVVPCWLANQVRVVMSDGSAATTTIREFSFVRRSAVDDAVPIWDVALAGSWRVWVLTSVRGGADGRRAGGRLTRSNRRGTDEAFVDLNPAARLILWADDNRCVLLSTTGQLLEVSDR